MNCFLIYRRQLNLLLFAYKSAALQKLSFPVIKIVFSAGVENASKLKLDPLFATTPGLASSYQPSPFRSGSAGVDYKSCDI